MRYGVTLQGIYEPAEWVELVQWIEDLGFDNLWITDSSLHAGDCYVYATLALERTSSITVGTAVTNPLTRHPAITANAFGRSASSRRPRRLRDRRRRPPAVRARPSDGELGRCATRSTSCAGCGGRDGRGRGRIVALRRRAPALAGAGASGLRLGKPAQGAGADRRGGGWARSSPGSSRGARVRARARGPRPCAQHAADVRRDAVPVRRHRRRRSGGDRVGAVDRRVVPDGTGYARSPA